MKVAAQSEDEVAGVYQVVGKITQKQQMVCHVFILIQSGVARADLLCIYLFVILIASKHR